MNEAIKLENGKRAFDVTRNGEPFRWEYDIVEIKLKCEDLEIAHGLKVDKKTLPPTDAFLESLASILFEGCDKHSAYQIYFIVDAQFKHLHESLVKQLQDAGL